MRKWILFVVLSALIFSGCQNEKEKLSTSKIIVGNESVLVNIDTQPIEVNKVQYTAFIHNDKQKHYDNVLDIEKDLGYKFLISDFFYHEEYYAYYTNREGSKQESQIHFLRKNPENSTLPFLSMYFLTNTEGTIRGVYDDSCRLIELRKSVLGDFVAIIQTERDNSYVIEFFHENVRYSVTNIQASDLNEVYSIIDSFTNE